MLRTSNTRERPRIERKPGVIADGRPGATGSLRLHWPEYLMEAGESGVYLLATRTVATLLWHPASPLQRFLAADSDRRMLMGFAMGATVIAIVRSSWGKQSGAHFNPAVTFTFYRLGKVAPWDAMFYCVAQFAGAVVGVLLASFLLRGAPAHKAVHYAATMPGIFGDAMAFVAELTISFFLMTAILFTSNHKTLAPYTRYFAAILIAAYIAFESPVSGMSTNPARTFGPAFCGRFWHALWIYFVAPPLGMLAAGEFFVKARHGNGPYCAKLDHQNDKRCIFCYSEHIRKRQQREKRYG